MIGFHGHVVESLKLHVLVHSRPDQVSQVISVQDFSTIIKLYKSEILL